jgi:hypothetical protein
MNPIEIFSGSVQQAVLDQNRFRTSWVEKDTPQHLERLYWEEHAEYEEAKELCMMGADPEKYASEVGDLGYLYIKLFDVTGGRVPRKIQYDILKVHTECAELGFNLIEAVFYKVCRNDIKYPLMFSRNGYGYDGSRDLSKDQYRLMGGDDMFQYAYMMLADRLHIE